MLPTWRDGRGWTRRSRSGSPRWRPSSRCGKTKQVATQLSNSVPYVSFPQQLQTRSRTPFPTHLPATWSWKIWKPTWIPSRRCSSRNRKWWTVWTHLLKRDCQNSSELALSCENELDRRNECKKSAKGSNHTNVSKKTNMKRNTPEALLFPVHSTLCYWVTYTPPVAK